MNILLIAAFIIWIYLLTVLHRGKHDFFKFVVGSIGMFFFLVILIQPIILPILTKAVTSAAGFIGDLTGIFTAYVKYGMLFVSNSKINISLYIDYECAGVLEILTFTSLLWFFPLYNVLEKILINAAAIIWIFVSNVIRLFSICTVLYFGGNNYYYFAHTILGRLIFYGLTICLYFYVFTRSQIIKQKVGNFSYAKDNK